jgi:hypothetical protein
MRLPFLTVMLVLSTTLSAVGCSGDAESEQDEGVSEDALSAEAAVKQAHQKVKDALAVSASDNERLQRQMTQVGPFLTGSQRAAYAKEFAARGKVAEHHRQLDANLVALEKRIAERIPGRTFR